jgi:prepilin-type N-terminal cleavage/methylation domain-containing protein
MMIQNKIPVKIQTKGFTLIEVILVVALITILATIVIIAVNPTRQLNQADDSVRSRHIKAISSAILQYQAETGSFPGPILANSTTSSGGLMEICRTDITIPDCTGLIDLSILIPNYLDKMPMDPSATSTYGTGYNVGIARGNRPRVTAPFSELSSIAVNPVVVPVPVSHWMFDEGSGTTAADYKNINSTTLGTNPSNPAWVIGQVGSGALSFDAGDDYAFKSPAVNFPTDEITVSFWVKSSGSGDGLFSYSAVAGGGNQNEFLINDQGGIDLFVGGASLNTSVSLNDGLWHHLAVSWQSKDGTVQIYKDGPKIFSGTHAQGDSIAGSGCIVFGQDQDSDCGGFQAGQAFGGTLDDIRLFDIALTPLEIQKLYDDTK